MMGGFSFEQVVDANDINSRLDSVSVVGVSSSGLIADTCCFVDASGEWIVSRNASPVGVYDGSGNVVLSGVYESSMVLVPGKFYYMRADGSLTHDPGSAFNGTKIGYSVAVDKLLVDIDIVGTGIPISAGFGDVVFTTVVGERQFSNMVSGVDYVVDGDTLVLNANQLYKFRNFTLGSGTTLSLMYDANSMDAASVLYIECTGDVVLDGFVNLKNRLPPGRYANSSVSINGRLFNRDINRIGLGGVSVNRGWAKSTTGYGHGGRAGVNVNRDTGVGSSGNGVVSDRFSVGVFGAGRTIIWRDSDPVGWNSYWFGGSAFEYNSRGAPGGGGAEVIVNSADNVRTVQAYGGQSGGFDADGNGNDGNNGAVNAYKRTWGSSWSGDCRAWGEGSGGVGGRCGIPGAHFYVRANSITVTGVVDCSGGNGGNGGNGGRDCRGLNLSELEDGGRFHGYGGYGGSGGGGAGGGDIIFEYYDSYTNVGTMLVGKGLGGSGGFRPYDTSSSSQSATPIQWVEQEGNGDDGVDGNIIVVDLGE